MPLEFDKSFFENSLYNFMLLKRYFSSLGRFKLPVPLNEPLKTFSPGSLERENLTSAIKELKASEKCVPVIINGERIFSGNISDQVIGGDHQKRICQFHEADETLTRRAIEEGLKAKKLWQRMPLEHRASVFLKAADLLTTKYRYQMMAATMLGQGKNIYQAEIDCITELADFWRFNCHFAEKIYEDQPLRNNVGNWNRVEYRPLDGFVAAISPFNFTAIGGNLCSAPALMGNSVVWKPSSAAVYSNYLVYKILEEAGLPPGVIQFLPGSPQPIVNEMLSHKALSGIHFTGSTFVFREIWKQVGNRIESYSSYPRLVGETGGKNLHFIHESADLLNAAANTIRSAFEYQGQKCSACSRLYVPDSVWPKFKQHLLTMHSSIKVGPVDGTVVKCFKIDFTNFCTNVINKQAFDKIKSYIDYARSSSEARIIAGGECNKFKLNQVGNDEKGYFIHPTIIETSDIHFKTMKEEIFGPVLTVFVYPAKEYEKYAEIAANSSEYALTAGIFASERSIIQNLEEKMLYASGNLYINDKSTGAIVGQQPFGGSKASGTNDKAGALMNLLRWTSARAIKENFIHISDYIYPSNLK
ncbi:delta-1-pyrroline-5-carboxylate dehydrogenase [Rozella allomycis CSF55]|uniref:Multifunctional fusion protein n=1 Tax=Rozella allomycis (strain CSF55) TaxID=988480 RepID=A0A075AUX1_ROZAC|nr:1-pyrroline-5-carboxylate dehydrogenase domain-containing protein [Rozella allomycis CSF55]RKP17486.1 delta-1-pyrroline-5-carboxylate dehydrogenase [Rozella allomycis CSF55]|eukprot:EPZ33960.1 1-pyrroline-5-carboxylate dehydrogenase domain-containing protein [Rozella allomycis CSF55]